MDDFRADIDEDGVLWLRGELDLGVADRFLEAVTVRNLGATCANATTVMTSSPRRVRRASARAIVRVDASTATRSIGSGHRVMRQCVRDPLDVADGCPGGGSITRPPVVLVPRTVTSMERARSPRTAALAGIIGPLAFLIIGFGGALVRSDLIRAQGWTSWPSSMALGGIAGLPQIVAFLGLAVSYPIFALRAVRPVLGDRLAWGGFLGIAIGDGLLAAPTDAAGQDLTWHGAIHLAGVLIATAASLVAAVGVTRATLGDPTWKVWRVVGAPAIVVAIVIGAAVGFESGWAKVIYVLGITLPVPLVAILVRRGWSARSTTTDARQVG